MQILIACEFSGIVRDAFRARGHDAWSCDLEPCEGDPKFHIQGDVLEYLNEGWDMLIAHPPCTFLCNSGVRWLYNDGKKSLGVNAQRWLDMTQACEFYIKLRDAEIPKIAIENPIMHEYARAACGEPSQYIQPWQHGHGEVKATGLQLRSLPLLEPSQIVTGRAPRVHFATPGPDRWKERSRTLPGIALAMATQWG